MSSQPERSEKTCLNCHASLVGRFCHVCGQENVVTKQNFWSLVQHFIYDLFHFDGKFFETLRYLLFSPGRVPKEFIAGRRASFLQPIRMYLFTSAFFFLVFFSVGNYGFTLQKELLDNDDRKEFITQFERYLNNYPSDSVLIQSKLRILKDTMRPLFVDELFTGLPFPINGKLYREVSEYDSVQKSLPDSSKDDRIKKLFTRKLIAIHNERGGDPTETGRAMISDFAHKFPYLLFVSLPFFAGILKLLYRRRRDLFYSDHAIFSIYHYIISFILLLFIYVLDQLNNWLNSILITIIVIGLMIWWWVYLFKSMRRFYEQSRLKTLLKFILLTFIGFLLMMVLFLIFIFITAYQL